MLTNIKNQYSVSCLCSLNRSDTGYDNSKMYKKCYYLCLKLQVLLLLNLLVANGD